MHNEHLPRAEACEYGITVRRSEIDGEMLYLATVAEFPNVKAIGESMSEAYDLAIDAITTLQQSALEMGHTIPRPAISTEEYSGRITLRMPSWLHQQLDLEAKRDEVSLNQTIITLLAARSTAAEITNNVCAEIRSITRHLSQKNDVSRSEKFVEQSISGVALEYSARNSTIIPETENGKWKSLH